MKKDSPQRLLEVINHLNMNPNSFAISLGFPRAQRIYDVLNSKAGISGKLAATITNKYPQFNTGWLLTGDGEMLKPGGIEKPTKTEVARQQASEIDIHLKLIERLEESEAKLIKENSDLKEENQALRGKIKALEGRKK